MRLPTNGYWRGALLWCSTQLAHGCDVTRHVLYGVERRHDERECAPPTEQKVLNRELREMPTDTTLTQVSLDFVGSADEEHSNIAVETDTRRLAHVSTTLTAPQT